MDVMHVMAEEHDLPSLTEETAGAQTPRASGRGATRCGGPSPPPPCYTGPMRTRIAFAALATLAATGLGYAVQAQQAAPTKVVVYKSPT